MGGSKPWVFVDTIDKILEMFNFLSAIREGFYDAILSVRAGPA